MLNRRTSILVASLMLLAAMPSVLTAGCGDPNVYGCDHPIAGRRAHDGQFDACCYIDSCPSECVNEPCVHVVGRDAGADANSSCPGTCVPVLPPEGWEGPGLFWIGPEGTAPACPADVPVVAYEAHVGLITPPTSCGACSCSASAGDCAPPLSFTASSKSCGGGSGMLTPFDGPPAWDGSCTAKDCISPAPTCAHPMSVQSLTAGPLVVTEQGCMPSTAIAPDPGTPSWTSAVLACRRGGFVDLGCDDPGETCLPFVAPPEFTICLFHTSDVSCPDTYPEKHLVYDGIDDQRTCSACACSAPAGSSCTASLNVFKDSACSMPLLTSTVGSSGAACVDLVLAGLPLGSKTITNLAYQPGSCVPSGGEPSGTVEPAGPATFCCVKK